MLEIIIANTDVGALFKSAENILSKYPSRDVVPESIKGQAALSVIKHLSKKDYFSICEVQSLAKMNDVTISAEHTELFRSLHCINWDEIHPETKAYLFAVLVDYFKGNIAMVHATK